MRCFVVGDVHWSTYSSILRSRDDECSTRLKNLLLSVDWAESESKSRGCDVVVYLGDFFDRPELTSEEITILQKVSWNLDAKHFFIVGNHESGLTDLRYSSTKVLEKNGFVIVDRPCVIDGLVFVPYANDPSSVDLHALVEGIERPVVFSHNDIKGIRYGAYMSKNGFELKDIESLGGIYVNGHLHNQTKFEKDGRLYAINLGNLTGQNFSEDAFVYPHQAMILDSDTLDCSFVDNPHAIGFYKIDEGSLSSLNELGDNAVVSVRCDEGSKDDVLSKLIAKGVLAYKITIIQSETTKGETNVEKTTDHLGKFREFVMERLGTSDAIMRELGEICR